MASQKTVRKKRKPANLQGTVRTKTNTSVKVAFGRLFSYNKNAVETRTGVIVESIRDPGKSNLLKHLSLFVSSIKAIIMGWFGNGPS